jgi:hypothetical protein
MVVYHTKSGRTGTVHHLNGPWIAVSFPDSVKPTATRVSELVPPTNASTSPEAAADAPSPDVAATL